MMPAVSSSTGRPGRASVAASSTRKSTCASGSPPVTATACSGGEAGAQRPDLGVELVDRDGIRAHAARRRVRGCGTPATGTRLSGVSHQRQRSGQPANRTKSWRRPAWHALALKRDEELRNDWRLPRHGAQSRGLACRRAGRPPDRRRWCPSAPCERGRRSASSSGWLSVAASARQRVEAERPARAATVVPSTHAPAASVGPSTPSVPAASRTPGSPASATAAASASCCERPPRPPGTTRTVVSPPATMATGRDRRRGGQALDEARTRVRRVPVQAARSTTMRLVSERAARPRRPPPPRSPLPASTRTTPRESAGSPGLTVSGTRPSLPASRCARTRAGTSSAIEPPVEHGERGAERGRVGDGRTRGDRCRVVADDVRQEKRPQPRRAAGGARQAAALHARAVLPHCVQRRDVGAGREERAAHRLLVLQREVAGRGHQESRRSAAQQHQHQGVGTRPLDARQHALRRGDSRGVGHRMRGPHDVRVPGGPRRHLSARLGHDDQAVARMRGAGALRHGEGRLASRDQQHRPAMRSHDVRRLQRQDVVAAPQRRRNQAVRLHRRERGVEARPRRCAQLDGRRSAALMDARSRRRYTVSPCRRNTSRARPSRPSRRSPPMRPASPIPGSGS